ncbi:MAG: glycosyltransferase family 4 protein [Promethearchaeota archaeon]
MIKILVFTQYYLPGYKGGGPIRTISNMVSQLTDFKFKIITYDRDLGESQPYSNIIQESWNKMYNADIYYLPPRSCSLGKLKKIINDTKFDIYYLNSFFSINLTLKPLILFRLKQIPKKPIILAPRGEFLPGAINIKRFLKLMYIILFRILGLHKDIKWHASNFLEDNSIKKWMGKKTNIFIAPNLREIPNSNKIIFKRIKKKSGFLKIIFISRISKKKNLDYAIKILRSIKGNIEFNIYGPIDDVKYWEKCKKIIKNLPSNICIKYMGSIPQSNIIKEIQKHHLLFLPTKGENFGHIIYEAIIAGRPLLISNNTPWNHLSVKNIGWDLPLEEPNKFKDMIQYMVNLDDKKFQILSNKVFQYRKKIIKKNYQIINKNIELFLSI